MPANLLFELHEPNPAEGYTLEQVARFTQLPRRQIVLFCRCGVVAPVRAPDTGGWAFDDEGLRRLRRLAELRAAYQLNFRALRLVAELLDQVERLREELRGLRAR